MSDQEPFLDEQHTLQLADSAIALKCHKLVRSLPGKRQVFYADWGGQRVFAKIFQDPQRAEIHWQREIKGLNALYKANIAAPKAVYAGVVKNKPWLVILLAEIAPAQSMAEAWRLAESDEDRLSLMEQVVDLIVVHHQSGIQQHDLHLNNFLLHNGQLYTLDGADIEAHPAALAQEPSLDNLALLLAQNFPVYDRFAESLLERYQKGRDLEITESTSTFLQRVRKRREKRKNVYLKKTLRECSAFACYKTADYQLIVDRDFYTGSMKAFLRDPDSSCPEPETLLKDGNSSTVWRTDVDGHNLVVKRYNVKSFTHGLKLSVRKGRSHISWQNAHRLLFYGITTPHPVVLYRNTRNRLRPTTYFIASHANGVDLREWFSDSLHSIEQQSAMAEKLAVMFSHLAALWISHGDLKATNILIVDEEPLLIDLDSMQQHRSFKTALPALKKDRDRFMQNWQKMPQIEATFTRILQPLSSDQERQE
jgi:tRNA A-37 threonylcarbamoyl transferase component Bud32